MEHIDQAYIVQIDETKDNVLRQEAMSVTQKEWGSDALKNTVKIMQQKLLVEYDGVALAAPQIGISKRIFVVASQAYTKETKWKPLVFINPTIIKASKKNEEMQEGCLSVRWIYGKTMRATSVTVEAYDSNGNKFTYGASGLIAQIFQHEIDHLHGILFIDKGYDFEEFSEEEMRKSMEKKVIDACPA